MRAAVLILAVLSICCGGGSGEFIVSRWGRPAFLRLSETNADLPGVLGVTAAEFEAAWQSYVRQRYLA